jgi:hypothetical protein
MTTSSIIDPARSTPEKMMKVDWHSTMKEVAVELVMGMVQVVDKEEAMVVKAKAMVKDMVVVMNIQLAQVWAIITPCQ